LPLAPHGEKGIDVWLALEAYELAIYKRFDVSVLVACDGDFLPLVRKLNTLGTRVMLLGWDFIWIDQNNEERETRTAQVLLDVTYPIMMHRVIDDRSRRNDPLINGLFVPQKERKATVAAATSAVARVATAFPGSPASTAGDAHEGSIQHLKEGFGFVLPKGGGSNIFFFHAAVTNADFNELKVGDKVPYCRKERQRAMCC
jgi:cold shock CspA family protein